jgi:hypothetical protein
MEPLDLTQRPPRGPRETMLGVMFLPRTIDKLRAELPGGNLDGYFTDWRPGLSSYLMHKLKLDFDELRDVVARANDESEIVAWLRPRIDPAVAEEVNRKLLSLKLTPENREIVEANQPVAKRRPDLVYLFEILEADEAERFPSLRG